MVTNVSGPVRARDLRRNIQEFGVEQGVTMTLELLLEEHSADRQQMRELAQLLFQCIDQVAQIVKITGGMQDRIDTLRRVMQQEDEGDAKQ